MILKPQVSIAWPYDAIFAGWDKLSQGLKRAARHDWPQTSREDIEDAILDVVELLETKKPRHEENKIFSKSVSPFDPLGDLYNMEPKRFERAESVSSASFRIDSSPSGRGRVRGRV